MWLVYYCSVYPTEASRPFRTAPPLLAGQLPARPHTQDIEANLVRQNPAVVRRTTRDPNQTSASYDVLFAQNHPGRVCYQRVLTVYCGDAIPVFWPLERLYLRHLIDPERGSLQLLLSSGLLALHVRPKQLHAASDGRNMF